MDIKVYPGKLQGTVKAPPSKSLAHRALICAALADGESRIRGISGSKDMDATIGCIRALGAWVAREGSECRIRGVFADRVPDIEGGRPVLSGRCEDEAAAGKCFKQAAETSGRVPDIEGDGPLLDCIESGSTLRFMLPVAAALGAEAAFTGRGKLPERPMTPLAVEMKKNGVQFLPEGRDHLPFRISGQLMPGRYTIPGNVSSQYISGLLFALPLLKGDSEIIIDGRLESASYINLTLDMIRQFGIEIRKTDNGFAVPGGQRYRARDCEVEGDHSNGAFWLAAGAMGSDLKVLGLAENSAQGDREVISILRDMGAGCEIHSTETAELSNDIERRNPDDLTQRADNKKQQSDSTVQSSLIKGSPIHAFAGTMKGITIDCSDIPDIVPILSVAATSAQGETVFKNAGRLRIKESDRLAAMAEVLTALGADVTESEDSLAVRGMLQETGADGNESEALAAEDPLQNSVAGNKEEKGHSAPRTGILQGGCEVDGHNDHRIVMSAAIAALSCREPVVIRGAEAVAKSYPDFFEVFRELGGRADVIADR